MCLYFPFPLYFLSLIPTISLSPGFCPGRCLPSLLLQFVSGKWGFPSPASPQQNHRVFLVSHCHSLHTGFLSSGAKAQSFLWNSRKCRPWETCPCRKVPLGMLWALALYIFILFSICLPSPCPRLGSAQVQISVCSGLLLGLDRALREELDKYSNILMPGPFSSLVTWASSFGLSPFEAPNPVEQQNRALTGGDTFLSHLRICQLIGLAPWRQFP